MNNLILVKNNIGYFDGRQVAKMIDKRHADLIRDISRYIAIISENAKLRFQDFFIKSNYKVRGNNKIYPCYLIIDILPMPKGRGFLDTNDTCLLK